MIELNQATFNNALDTMALLQNQFERIANPALDQIFDVPLEGRKAIEGCTGVFKQGHKSFQQQINFCFEQAEKILTP